MDAAAGGVSAGLAVVALLGFTAGVAVSFAVFWPVRDQIRAAIRNRRFKP